MTEKYEELKKQKMIQLIRECNTSEYGGEIEHLGRFELNTFVAEN